MTDEATPTNEQLRNYGWAPGGYTIRCSDCPPDTNVMQADRMGAKRSWRCREHAEARWRERERQLAQNLLPFNVNYSVHVKLNAKGVEILRKKHEDLARVMPSIGPFELKTDEFGFTKFQLWALMETFGAHISMGMCCPFETEILIPKDPQ